MNNNDNSNNSNFYNFNTVEEEIHYGLIPEGTLVKVRLKIQSGGYNDESRGWTGHYATHSSTTGAVYLRCEYSILSEKYKGRKIWSIIGLYSHKNENIWGDMGRSFIRSILNSRSGFSDKDNTLEAIAARQIESFADLEGSEFAARIDIEEGINGEKRNVISRVITPEHKQYTQIMNQASSENDEFIDDEISWSN